MLKGKFTREQMVEIFGEKIIDQLEHENCEPTNRSGYNGEHEGNDLTEWRSLLTVKHADYDYISAYYYTTNEQDKIMAEHEGDGSSINWEIEGFEINE